MTIYSHRPSRRSPGKTTQNTQQIITFLLGEEWFALAIDAIQKVLQLGKVYGDPQRKGVSLTHYQGQELLVIDVARRIFGTETLSSHQNTDQTRFLLIIHNNNNEIVGLPIDSSPSILRVSESAFIPLPDTYLTQGNIHCISSTIIQVNEQQSFFLLDVNQLMSVNSKQLSLID
ncbi:chemotaxis protein CheW [Crocosphaera chwakensis]|uniref:CheW protein n=1 Tax=Crocosphaera chwakensis CCY0110 TaxID=391612 RepID=A3IM10_9CHRO|nr:chemotaxis protein CheW [Crocosphaera chwakensis]EAZ92466.1 CheW protein [Crocosphaera chwakensis CCY0110]